MNVYKMWCLPKDNEVEKRLSEKYEDLLERQKKLEIENKLLREKVEKAETKWSSNIDAFVEQWYEDNRDEIDIGVVDLKFFKVDLMPDNLEKHIYKKVLKIVFSFLNSSLSPKLDMADEEEIMIQRDEFIVA